MIDEELKSDSVPFVQFWNSCHNINDKHFLTGSSGPSVWNSLCISDKIVRGAKVLNIGIGLGYCTKGLVEAGCIVDALDISPVALQRVAGLVRSIWLPSQFVSMPVNYYDIAISHLVTQHIPMEDLIKQVSYVVRGLTKKGVFAMQFACQFPVQLGRPICVMNIKAGGAYQTLPEMNSLVRSCGGRITWAKLMAVYQTKNACWFGVHIVRR